jgi:hypothetical protein
VREKLREREFDESWKKILQEYLWDFLEFYFPEISQNFEQSKGYSFLDSELSKITRESKNTHRRLDKLVRVYLKEEKEVWLLIHIEIQTYLDEDFGLRMFTYYYRVFDLYKKPLLSMAILADPHQEFRPNSYQAKALEKTFVDFQFLTSKILDWQGKEQALKKENNIFGIVTLASLKTYEKNEKKRYNWKYQLARMLYQRAYSKEKILALYEFLDSIMVLPEKLELQLNQKIIEYEEKLKMPYITSAEKIGIEKGRQEGRQEEARQAILDLLEVKFGEILPEIKSQLASITEIELLRSLLKKVISVHSLEEFHSLLNLP